MGTLDYYNDNASRFVEGTIDVSMTCIQDKFLSFMSAQSVILDLGCGSGRDSLYFKNRGFRVEAIDGSEELVKIARKTTGLPVRKLLFSELDYCNNFDGIWACASLLHVPKAEIVPILDKCFLALKKRGIFYLSFKKGDFEGIRNGRYFSDYTQLEVDKLLNGFNNNEILASFITKDARPDRTEEWVNVIVRKLV